MISTRSNATDATALERVTRNVVDRKRSVARHAGVAHPYLYIDYASAGRADEVFAGYSGAELQRLRRVQREVNPDSVFGWFVARVHEFIVGDVAVYPD